jgi:hypothetical protein
MVERDMKNGTQRAPRDRSWRFTQEMQQGFANWVRTLPFIKSAIRTDPAWKHLEERSVDHASRFDPIGNARVERSMDTLERH